MPQKILRGRRFFRDNNKWLQDKLLGDWSEMDLEETVRWYADITGRWRGKKTKLPKSSLKRPKLDREGMALLGCNDRFFLLTYLCHRKDLKHPWLFDRCREVEADPDGYLDLWARGHYKSTFITFGGIIQDIMDDPESTTAIFSVVKPIAQAFLQQIKDEFEANDRLKFVYEDVLYANPRTLGKDGRPSKWGVARGITVKRKGNPKEATIEAHGLLDGQPTSRHFNKHVYDDVVTQDYLSDDNIKKTTHRYEMADNLGTHLGVRKQVAGTFYHFNDTYVQIKDRGSLKSRIYPATDNGRLDGKPVLLTQERWDEIKRDQRSTVAAQMLLNPVAGNEATFLSIWLKQYEVIPAVLNVYILCDPSKGTGPRSDRSAIPVIGIDQGGNKYLLDGVCHRMKLTERWEWIKAFRRKWMAHPGVQHVKIGYEQYGMQSDLEVIKDMMEREKDWFEIVELGSPRQGGHSKNDRIHRLEPEVREGRFLLPSNVHHPDHGGNCFWSVWTEEHEKKAEERAIAAPYHIGQILHRPVKGLTNRQKEMEKTSQKYRIVTSIKRHDENDDVYDLTRHMIDELIRHPFAPHDDLIDAASRIYDIEPATPVAYEAQSTEPLDVESIHDAEAA